jgi:hypothetical protein
MTLALLAPEVRGGTVLHTYSVTISSAGIVRTTGILGLTALPPSLSLRLDRTRGEITGSFVRPGFRQSVYGALMRSDANLLQIGKGWVEGGSLDYQGATWSLQYAP